MSVRNKPAPERKIRGRIQKETSKENRNIESPPQKNTVIEIHHQGRSDGPDEAILQTYFGAFCQASAASITQTCLSHSLSLSAPRAADQPIIEPEAPYGDLHGLRSLEVDVLRDR